MSDPVYYSTIFCFVNSENRDWHLKRLPFFLLLRKLARAAGGRTLGQASFRIPQAIGLAGNAGRKPPSRHRTPPGRQCRVGSDAGLQGAKPLAKDNFESPLPRRGRGSGGWGQKAYAKAGKPGEAGHRHPFRISQDIGLVGNAGRKPPLPAPHPARQPDAAQAIPPLHTGQQAQPARRLVKIYKTSLPVLANIVFFLSFQIIFLVV